MSLQPLRLVELLAAVMILGIHALGGLEYHPSQAELEYIQEHSR